MKILIRQATIVDSNSKHHLKKRDLLIDGKRIIKISANVKTPAKVKTIEAKNLKISPGWVEMNANFCDPGFEHKEDLESGSKAAASGGYTEVGLLPNTDPVVSKKSHINYILNFSEKNIVTLHPYAALTNDGQNGEPSEIYELFTAGAKAFTNGQNAINNGFILNRALQYVLPFNGLVSTFLNEGSFSNCNLIHEGEVSVSNGLKGLPGLAEEMAAEKFIKLLNYNNSRLHFNQLSSKNTVPLIKAAKKAKLNLTSSVSPYHLIFTDKKLNEFDSNYKIDPPLRESSDKNALLKAVLDNTIDVISCFHQPQHEDDKKLEFEFAKSGVIGLQSTYPVLKTFLNDKLSDELIIRKLATAPRKILDLDPATIEEDNIANLTLFNDEQWNWKLENNYSKSINSPFIDFQFNAKVIGIFNKGKLFLNNFK